MVGLRGSLSWVLFTVVEVMAAVKAAVMQQSDVCSVKTDVFQIVAGIRPPSITLSLNCIVTDSTVTSFV
jgi:hypothetical protein